MVCWPRSSRWSERSPVPLPWFSELPPHSGSGPSWASPPRWRWPSAPSRTALTPAWPPSFQTCRSANEKTVQRLNFEASSVWGKKRQYFDIFASLGESNILKVRAAPKVVHIYCIWHQPQRVVSCQLGWLTGVGFFHLKGARGCLLKQGQVTTGNSPSTRGSPGRFWRCCWRCRQPASHGRQGRCSTGRHRGGTLCGGRISQKSD